MPEEERDTWNRQIIDEFRANDGKVGGNFEGMTLLILHTAGAKSGQERENPLAYQKVENGWAVFGSNAGRPRHPAWVHNLRANSDATIEVGAQTVPVRAHVAQGDEHDRIWAKQKSDVPGFADYEKQTERTIPVVVLEPR